KAGTTFGTLGDIDIGVRGVSEAPGGKGVAGKAEGGANSVGVYGQSASGIAGFFRGKVTVTESLLVMEVNAQKLTASKKLFTIDHPLDPANKFLSHSSVESNEMKNFYDGVVTLDDRGTARVSLPEWFEALNTDFRYQLTCIGQYAPVYVAQEVANHSF